MDSDSCIKFFENTIESALSNSIINRRCHNNINFTNILNHVNNCYMTLNEIFIDSTSSEQQKSEAFRNFNVARSKVNSEVLNYEYKTWNELLRNNDSSELWKKINWNGSLIKVKPLNPPHINIITYHYEKLYSCNLDIINLLSISTNIYIPILDDDFTLLEIENAAINMKKDNADFKKDMIKLLSGNYSFFLYLLMNKIFTYGFPISLTHTSAIAIPKKGDLSIPKNYRIIQCQKMFANLFDRLISNRLKLWINIEEEQSAYLKGKSTLDPIFSIRLIIDIFKKKNKKLFILFIDLSNAFDNVDRVKLILILKKMAQECLKLLNIYILILVVILHLMGIQVMSLI